MIVLLWRRWSESHKFWLLCALLVVVILDAFIGSKIIEFQIWLVEQSGRVYK